MARVHAQESLGLIHGQGEHEGHTPQVRLVRGEIGGRGDREVTPHGGHLRPIGGWWRRPAGVRVLKETEQRLRNRYGCGPESERGPDCRRAQGVCCSWRTNECVAYALAAVLSASAHGLEVERPRGTAPATSIRRTSSTTARICGR